jgi:porin
MRVRLFIAKTSFLCVSVLALADATHAEEAALGQNQTRAGVVLSPSSVAADLSGDPLTSPQYRSTFVRDVFAPWFEFKEYMATEYNHSIGFDYQALKMWSHDDPGDGYAASGQLRIYGTWIPFDDGAGNNGSFTWKVEKRDPFTDIVPQDYGFALGALSIPGTSFSNPDSHANWLMTNAFWTQRFNDGRATVMAGFIDVTDYLDTYGLINPRTAWSNLSFLTNPTIPAPDPGLGIAGGTMLGDNFYLLGGIADANGDPTLDRNPFDSFFETSEYFSHFEFGYTTGQDRIYFDNIHVTLWHADKREEAGVGSDWGMSGSAAWFLDNRWMPFLRAGFSQGNAPLYKRSVSGGIGYLTQQRDLMGVGINWADPGDELTDQWTLEAFYRFQLSEHFAVTADYQWINNPLLNPTEDSISIFGLRARLSM